jgi:hypothetical protein
MTTSEFVYLLCGIVIGMLNQGILDATVGLRSVWTRAVAYVLIAVPSSWAVIMVAGRILHGHW